MRKDDESFDDWWVWMDDDAWDEMMMMSPLKMVGMVWME